jgi:hypothetical protein
MLSKCANPKCTELFDFRRGRFFRLHSLNAPGHSFSGAASLHHFWLCDKCAEQYVLELETDDHAVLRSFGIPRSLLRRDYPAA